MNTWEYQHAFIESQQLEGTGKRSMFGLGAEKMRNVYAFEDVNKRLNECGAAGWELVNAEPHWIWGNQAWGAPLWLAVADKSRRRVEHVAAYPEYIVGWYCTFRRERPDRGEVPMAPWQEQQSVSEATSSVPG